MDSRSKAVYESDLAEVLGLSSMHIVADGYTFGAPPTLSPFMQASSRLYWHTTYSKETGRSTQTITFVLFEKHGPMSAINFREIEKQVKD